jgi:glutaredoxin 3
MNMSAVKIYTTPTCPYCKAAKALLSNKGAQFTEIDVEADPVLRLAVKELTGRRTVPQIFIGDLHVGGFDDLQQLATTGSLDALLHVPAQHA